LQEIIKADGEGDKSISPEISAIAMSSDRKLICIGTIQENAKLHFWELFSKTSLKALALSNIIMVTNIKFAYDSKHIVCLVTLLFCTL